MTIDSDPTAYLVTESTKLVGETIEKLNSIKTDFEGVNFEAIQDRIPETLTGLHASLSAAQAPIGGLKMLAAFAKTMSSVDLTDDEAATESLDDLLRGILDDTDEAEAA